MTELPRPTLMRAPPGEIRAIALVSAAHFVSHYYLLILPPLFAFVRSDYGVSYTELGLALSAFNIVSATVQTPTGFLVDRIGARPVLIAGLAIGGLAFAVAGLVDSFWVFVAMFACAGLGNTVYHPADYALLSQHVSEQRTGRAFAIHTFAGMVGSAVAPATLLFMHNLVGWRGAFVASAALGLVIAGVLAMQSEVPAGHGARKPRTGGSGAAFGFRLLFAPVILLNFAFFFLLSFINAGMQNYSVVATQALFGTPLAIGNTALTCYLIATAAGVLLGGHFIGRLGGHAVTATAGVAVTGIAAALIGLVDLGTVGLMLVMTLAGIATGWAMPSRDMLVRDVTPEGSFGKVFGFLSTGFNVAGVIAPIVFGQVMDHGNPRAVFLLSAAACLVGVATVITNGKRSW
jgi:MFS transporter, FSR family, fosmidomycin resistance protein